MSRLPSLLPYALASVGIVLASAIAIAPSVRDAPPEASPRPTQRAGLSDAGRMTYWKVVSDAESELWVSDLDGRRAWPLVREPATLEIKSTRWSLDGSSVAYVRGNTSVVVAGVDGKGTAIQMPRDLVSEELRIVGYSLSPSAGWISLTLQKHGSRNGPSDVYLVELPPERRRHQPPDGPPLPMVGAPPWVRATELGDAYAGRWISESDLFIETRGGMIARMDRETRQMWPVSGLHVTSPLLAGDGRLYFAGGGWVHADTAGGPWANGGIWSTSLDGSDARREVDRNLESFRLLGRLSDGRFVVGSPGTTYIVGQQLIPTPWQAGTIRRVIVPANGSDAIGITDSRVVRMFPSKVPDSSASVARPDAVLMLLDGVRDADVWFPPAKTASIPAPAPIGGPPARLAFVTGTTLFEASTSSGSLRALVSAPPGGWLGQPQWSPTGDRIAVVVGRPEEQPNSTLIVSDASGELWRSAKLLAPGFSWSPDGSQVAVTNWGEGDARTTIVVDARSGAPVTTHTGVIAQWTTRGLIGFDAGVIDPTQQRFRQWIDNSVYLMTGTDRRRITDARTLSSHPLLADVPGPELPAWVSQVDASPDGQLIGIWVYRIAGLGFAHGAFVVVDASGEPRWVDPFEPRSGMQDLSWSPKSAAVGMTLVGPDARQPGTAQTGNMARVLDGPTGQMLLEQPGSFAGWSPDGDWVYVGRPEGLFAYPLAGGDGVRVGPFGVRVYATRP